MSLNNGASFYAELAALQQTREERLESIQKAVRYIEEAIEIRRDLGLRADLSASLNNGANLYAGLAALQQTREERLESIQKAVRYIEEAIEIYRDLGLRVDLSASLNNGASFYAELAALQQTREERLGSVQKAVRYIEEAIEIYRDLGLRADLSASLNNGASFYAELATLLQTREERLGSVQKAVRYIEEAIIIYRDLGLFFDLAHSLAISVFIYLEYLEFNEEVIAQLLQNCDEAIDIFETFELPSKYCPLLQIGIKFHRLSYQTTKSIEHSERINKYETLLLKCE